MSNYYICKVCKNNNHGWCEARKMNGLKNKNIQRCSDFNPSIDEEEKYLYNIEYQVFNIPGKDNGFKSSFTCELETDNLDDVEDYALEELGEYFAPGNFLILNIGVVK